MKIQYRCPNCLKKLFSWEKGEDNIEYHAPIEKRKTHGHMLIECPKCKTTSVLQRERLEKAYEQHDPKGVQTERPSIEKLKRRKNE